VPDRKPAWKKSVSNALLPRSDAASDQILGLDVQDAGTVEKTAVCDTQGYF
jgi:hypothetical protein